MQRLLRALNWIPADRENVPVLREGAPRALRPGGRLRVLTWNLQYAGTRRHHFFYDGGRAVSVPPADVEEALAGILAVLRDLDADVCLLQEVDRRSRRTGYVDQLARLQAGHPYPVRLSTPVHRSAWVPHPAHAQLGPIDLHMAMLLRVPVVRGHRVGLAPLHEPAWRQAFNLHRALLVAEGEGLAVGTTHLSAFSRGDGTLPAQVAQLLAWITSRAGAPWILGGDFNLLPPGDDPARLGAEAVEYPDAPSPLLPLLAVGRSVLPLDPPFVPIRATYLPPGADRADRVLDYLFVSEHFVVEHADVVPIPAWLSDHRPIVADLRWTS